MKPAIQKIVTRIKETNEKFLKSSPEQQRVTIARDVISWLNVGKLRAQKGRVIDFEMVDSDYTAKPGVKKTFTKTYLNGDEGVQTLLFEDAAVSCSVCAKGAMFMGVIGRVNKMLVGEISGNSLEQDTAEMRKLNEFFEEKQMSLIETAFEGRTYMYCDFYDNQIKFSVEELEAAKDYIRTYPDPTQRMKVICKNIIKNKGTFIP